MCGIRSISSRRWSQKSEISVGRFIVWLGMKASVNDRDFIFPGGVAARTALRDRLVSPFETTCRDNQR